MIDNICESFWQLYLHIYYLCTVVNFEALSGYWYSLETNLMPQNRTIDEFLRPSFAAIGKN